MPGHVLDANTIGLWSLRERERKASRFFDAAPAGRHLVCDMGASAANVPTVAPGRNNIGTARRFNGGTLCGGMGPGDPALLACFLGSCTVEVWVKYTGLTSGVMLMFLYAATGETSSTNYLGQLYLTAINSTTAKLGWFHEQGAGANVQFDQSTLTTVVTKDTWTHVAAVKTVSGSNCTIAFYINGALIQTSGTLTNCTGGDVSVFALGNSANVGIADPSYQGDMKDMRISSVARSAGEIAASAAATDQKHAIDLNTVSLYRMEETADAADQSTQAMHLSMPLHDVAGTEDSNFELFDIDTCGGRYFSGETEYVGYSAHPANDTYRQALEGDFTFETWVKLDGTLVCGSTGGVGLFSYGSQAGSTSTATNAIGVRVDYSGGGVNMGTLTAWAYHGAGVVASYTTTAKPFNAAGLNKITHVAITKRSVGGGNFKWEFYINGVFVEESSSQVNYQSQAGNSIYWRLGFADSSTFKSLKGIMYDARLSNVRRSAGEILMSYATGVPCLALAITPASVLGFATTAIVNTAPQESELGVDLDVITDVNPSFTLCGGYKNMGNAIARRLSTPRGALEEIGDDPDYGYDIRGLLNADMTTAEIAGIASQVEKEIMKEDRVQSADVVSTFSFSTYALAMEINILLKTGGTFRLVLGVGTATVDVIDEGIDKSAVGS